MPGTTPPWGTPIGPVLEPGPVYGAPGVAGEDGGYVVLIERTTGSGETMRWDLHWPPQPAATLAQARALALQAAHQHRPQHPHSPQRRSVFRLSEDCYLVMVEGLMKSFHFRISVAVGLPDRPDG